MQILINENHLVIFAWVIFDAHRIKNGNLL